MTENKKQRLNPLLLLPAGLLVLEIVIYIILGIAGYEITKSLTTVFILFAIFLIYQIGKQLYLKWRVTNAVKKIETAQELADSGSPMMAIRLWKKLLLNLPKEHYLDVLSAMKETYQQAGMIDAVQQVKAIQSESIEFFEWTRNVEGRTAKDRRKWQNRAIALRTMVKALPDEKGESLSDTDIQT